MLTSLYLDGSSEKTVRWSQQLLTDGMDTQRIHELFAKFYTERFADRNGTPERYWDEIESFTKETVSIVDGWNTDPILQSDKMRVIADVL